MKRFSLILFAISFVIFLISLLGFFLDRPIQRENFYASVNIGDKIGFDVNSSSLSFGDVILRSNSVRNIVFKNEYNFPVAAKINAEGNIKDMLYFDDAVYVEKGGEKKIPINLIADYNNSYGFYSGNVSFEIYKR